MKKFSEDHGGVAIILIVIAVLLLIVGSVKGLDEGTGKVNGSGVASVVGNAYSNAIDKFKNSFDETLASGNVPTSGPNGEDLVSKTESQVGKYADIDGDGTVGGIIFADLLFGGSGKWENENRGKYSIPTITTSKEYYVSQNSYTNKFRWNCRSITPTEKEITGFILCHYLIQIQTLIHGTLEHMNGGIEDDNIITSKEFCASKSNSITMIKKWNSSAYGNQNSMSKYTDVQNEVQTQIHKGWFVPSSQEWAAFEANLNIKKSNYSNKGLKGGYWSSSLDSKTLVDSADFTNLYISNEYVHNQYRNVRLATTF